VINGLNKTQYLLTKFYQTSPLKQSSTCMSTVIPMMFLFFPASKSWVRCTSSFYCISSTDSD